MNTITHLAASTPPESLMSEMWSTQGLYLLGLPVAIVVGIVATIKDKRK